ncbi:MAG TPA: ankyrin repeat domain-containing protein [Stellaceae bacterium]|nr:ankyrin repeat domain-containing protein [Stellaceae bacterium]
MVAVLLRALGVLLLIGLTLDVAMAGSGPQAPFAGVPPPPTPFTGIPTVPKTLPLLGSASADGRVLAAAEQGNADQIAWIMAAGGNCDEADSEGHTALMHAAMANYTAVATALIAHGAQLDLRDRLGDTALHWAAQSGSTGVLRVLLAAHATVDIADGKGQTPLMLAARNNHPDAVRLLLQYHADPRKADYTGRDAIGWAQNFPRIQALMQNASLAF